MMKMLGLVIVALGLLLSGCVSSLQQPNMQQIQNSYSQEQTNLHYASAKTAKAVAAQGYVCTASNQRLKTRPSTAWSPRLDKAKAFALSECESAPQFAESCKIEACRRAGPGNVAVNDDDHWITCYAPNQEKPGVWSATSHERGGAEKVAYNRCLKFSGASKDCFMDYCSVW